VSGGERGAGAPQRREQREQGAAIHQGGRSKKNAAQDARRSFEP